jgi:hypothetical protein
VAPAGSAIVQAIRHRRIDALAVTVVIFLVLSAGVSVIAGSPRFLLAKDAVLTAVWGTWFLLSLRGHRPLTFRFTRPLLEAHRIFDPRTRTWSGPTERSWDRKCWNSSRSAPHELRELLPRFRRMWQVTTVIWGAAFLLDAALRVVMAYALPVNDVPALAGALWLVTFLLLQIITNVYLSRSGLWPILRGHQPTVPLDPSDRHTTGTRTNRTAAGPQK